METPEIIDTLRAALEFYAWGKHVRRVNVGLLWQADIASDRGEVATKALDACFGPDSNTYNITSTHTHTPTPTPTPPTKENQEEENEERKESCI